MASSVNDTGNAAFADIPNPLAPYALGDLTGLTLANGMTAGYGVALTPGGTPADTANPPMQPGAYGGNPKLAPQRIGVLRNIPGTIPSAGGGFYSLYFFFNPNQINVSFYMNGQSTPPLYLYGAGGLGDGAGNALGGTATSLAAQVPNMTNSQTVAWSLIFDRTYDFFNDPGGRPDLDRGVLKDVAALYNLMGTFDSNGAVPVSTPVQVVFGRTGDGQLWGFTGYISSVNITYGIFRQNMIPSRCEVDLQLTAVYVSSAVPASSSGTGAVSSASGVALSTAGGVATSSPAFGAPVQRKA